MITVTAWNGKQSTIRTRKRKQKERKQRLCRVGQEILWSLPGNVLVPTVVQVPGYKSVWVMRKMKRKRSFEWSLARLKISMLLMIRLQTNQKLLQQLMAKLISTRFINACKLCDLISYVCNLDYAVVIKKINERAIPQLFSFFHCILCMYCRAVLKMKGCCQLDYG